MFPEILTQLTVQFMQYKDSFCSRIYKVQTVSEG